jgi:hypothetical protein
LFDYPGKVVIGVSDEKDYLVDNPNRRCPDLTKSQWPGRLLRPFWWTKGCAALVVPLSPEAVDTTGYPSSARATWVVTGVCLAERDDVICVESDARSSADPLGGAVRQGFPISFASDGRGCGATASVNGRSPRPISPDRGGTPFDGGRLISPPC